MTKQEVMNLPEGCAIVCVCSNGYRAFRIYHKDIAWDERAHPELFELANENDMKNHEKRCLEDYERRIKKAREAYAISCNHKEN